MATESAVMAVIRASRPSFRNPHDKVAFAVHASFLAAGFSLIATGKNALSDKPPIGGEEVGIEGWNELEDSYGFLYSKTEKCQQKNVLVRCLVIGDTLAIDVLNLEGEQKEPFNLQIKSYSRSCPALLVVARGVHIDLGILLDQGMDSFRDGYEIILSAAPSTAKMITAHCRRLHYLGKLYARMRDIEQLEKAKAMRRKQQHDANKGKNGGN